MDKVLIANWKMHPLTEREAIALAKKCDAANVVICPPFPFLGAVEKTVTKAKIGAQDTFWEEKGAYTGEVSPAMLKKMGVSHVIIGHSERRRYLGETDEMVNKKVRAAIHSGLTPILCVGEPLAVRKKGISAAKRFVAAQLRKDLQSVHGKMIVVYEPIWAISAGLGTGNPDNPQNVAVMVKFMRDIVGKKLGKATPLLYGGSATSGNLGRLITGNFLDGALVGGASLNAKEFRSMIQIARNKR